jgi:hypothetical protein
MAAETETVNLHTTRAATSDEMFGDPEGCQHCDHDSFLLIEINAAKGQRKWTQACSDCAQEFHDAPDGLYDPTVLAYSEDADFDA